MDEEFVSKTENGREYIAEGYNIQTIDDLKKEHEENLREQGYPVEDTEETEDAWDFFVGQNPWVRHQAVQVKTLLDLVQDVDTAKIVLRIAKQFGIQQEQLDITPALVNVVNFEIDETVDDQVSEEEGRTAWEWSSKLVDRMDTNHDLDTKYPVCTECNLQITNNSECGNCN